MNIVITLPPYLVKKILSGEKKIEFRKNYPRNFNPTEDAIFMLEKGTRHIVGFFTISKFICKFNPLEIWEEYKEQLGVKKIWFQMYAPTYRPYWIWQIDKTFKFDKPIDRAFFDIEKNPQSYSYTTMLVDPTFYEQETAKQ